MKLKGIHRTSTISWSPADVSEPMLCCGSVAGAMDATFSSKTELEILGVGPQGLQRRAAVASSTRFNRISWGSRLIAAGKEDGDVELWLPDKLLADTGKDALSFSKSQHSGPVKGLHFNTVNTQLLASGSSDGEVFFLLTKIWIWDLAKLDLPYHPGPKSQKLEDITALQWNKQVPHILAAGSTNGYTVLFDLRQKKELLKLPYPGGRRPVTSVAWNPDAPTQIITSSDDDSNPVILLWDLRNASAAEKTISGHSKGVLSVDWCPKDSGLLLSCGKDNTTIVWDLNLSEPIGELAKSNNWAFDVQWCPRNPDLCAVASYDGTIGIHSLQGGTEPQDANTVFTFSPNAINNTMNSETQQHDPNEPFAHIGSQVLATPLAHADFPDISFVLTRPPRWLRKPVGSSWGFGGQLVSFDFEAGSKITIKNVFSDQHFSDNLDDLEATILDPQYSVDYCSQKVAKASNESERDVWIFLKSLLSEDCRLEMLEFLNFEKNVSSSASFKSLVTKLHILHPPSKMTESHVKSPKSEGVNETASNFALFPTGVSVENEIDKIITQCLLVNDYSAAVDLCLSANRIADAFAFSMMGPLELQVKVRDEYIARTKKTKPYCRVLEAITKNDLTDIVENCQIAPKNIWKELVAFICTHANDDDCPVLLSTLGARLEGKFEGKQSTTISAENSHAAAICYVGSGHLDRVVRIWLSQIPITEQLLVAKKGKEAAHLEAIQSFIEKIWIFRYAISFFDADLPYKLEEGETYTLQDMYLFLENFSLLAANMGKISIAYLTLEQIPPSFIGNGSLASLRDRVYTYMNAEMPQGSLSPFEINDIFACLDIQQGYNNSKFGNSNIGNNHNQQAQQQQAQQQQAQQFSHNNNPTNLYQYGQPQQNAPYQDSGHKSYQRAPEPYFPPQPTYNQPTYEPQQSFGGGFNNRNTNPIVSLGSTGHAPPVTGEHYQPPTFTPAVVRNPSQPAIPYQQIPSHQQLPYQPIPSHQQLPYQQIPSHQKLPYNSNNQNYPPAPNAHIEPPVSNRHPVGDTSHIPAGQKATYEGLLKHWKTFANAENQERKIIDDAQKRIDLLFDQMNNQEIPQQVADELSLLVKSLDKNDFIQAQKISLDLMTKRFDITGQWIVAIKRIIDFKDRASRPSPEPPVSQSPVNANNSFGQSPNSNAYRVPPTSNPYGAPPIIINPNAFAGPNSGSNFGVSPVNMLKPANSNQNSNQYGLQGTSNAYGAPSYGAPPTNTYGAPPTTSNAPSPAFPTLPTASYGAPPTASYGAPPTASYGVPPTASYGVPPTTSYGVPQSPKTSSYGAASIPAYGAPPTQSHYMASAPINATYGAPPTSAYAAPQKQSYGAPPINSSAGYGAPPVGALNDSKVQSQFNHGAPPVVNHASLNNSNSQSQFNHGAPTVTKHASLNNSDAQSQFNHGALPAVAASTSHGAPTQLPGKPGGNAGAPPVSSHGYPPPGTGLARSIVPPSMSSNAQPQYPPSGNNSPRPTHAPPLSRPPSHGSNGNASVMPSSTVRPPNSTFPRPSHRPPTSNK